MPPLVEAFCPHERRPSTAICLRCRREARLATRARQRRAMVWVGGVALAVAVVGLIAVSGAEAFTGWRPPAWLQHATFSRTEARRNGLDVHRAGGDSAVAEATAGLVGSVAGPTIRPPAAVPPPRQLAARVATPATTPGGAPPLAPIVAEGRTLLRDSVVAIRTGASVSVHFDTPGARTRRADKFERIVRATLPAIYGPAVDSFLSRMPAGSLSRAGNLVTELPRRGFRLPVGSGWTLTLWPETRLGHDGPLVVTYRALVTR